jgi:uncharacterized protein
MSQATPSRPWWKFAHLWMVIAGPVLVVIASFVTLFLAIRTPETIVVDGAQPQSGSEQSVREKQSANLLPAMTARNHAASAAFSAGAKD